MPNMREGIAYHEAGHAVALLQLGIPFRYVTMCSRQPGVRARVAAHRGYIRTKPERASLIAASGPIAHARYYGADARFLMKHADMFGWMADLQNFWTAEDLRPGADMGRSWYEHEDTLTSLWPSVEAVARELLASPRALTYAEVQAITSM